MPRLDRLEDTMIRGAQIVMQVLSKKFDLNANLDKERKRASKDGVFQNFSHTVVSCGNFFAQRDSCFNSEDDSRRHCIN